MPTQTPSPTPSAVNSLNWSIPSTIEATGVHHGYSTVPLVSNGRRRPEAERFAEHLEGAVWAVVSKLDPGGYILPHRDKGPHYTRTQIPLSPGGWYWDEVIGAVQMTPGINRVNHHLAHAIWNDTQNPRVHLVIDREPVHADLPFVLYPAEVCPELARFLA